MHTRVLGLLAAAGVATAAGTMSATVRIPVEVIVAGGGIGPDVAVDGIYNFAMWDPGEGDYVAYAFGTRACNVGDAEISWRNGGVDNRHPVIALNLYRLHDDRMIQVGQSWLKHGFCAVDGDACGSCQDNQTCEFLGVGCSDPYNAELNGWQVDLSMRSEVNPFSGFFPFPPSDPPWSGEIDRRLRVHRDDVDPSASRGARWFAEAIYIAADDAIAGNADNNASYREVEIIEGGAIEDFAAPTISQRSALFGWSGALVSPVNVSDEGRLNVGSKAIDNGDGTWRYEYAVFNLNSDRGIGSFSIPVGPSVDILEYGFHDVDYHSGETYDDTDWSVERAGGVVRWATTPWSKDPNANAIRWGTQYNFWFVTDAPPTTGECTMECFKPHLVPTVQALVRVPESLPCPADCGDGDGTVDIDDLLALLDAWGFGAVVCELDGDGAVGLSDLMILLEAFGPCP